MIKSAIDSPSGNSAANNRRRSLDARLIRTAGPNSPSASRVVHNRRPTVSATKFYYYVRPGTAAPQPLKLLLRVTRNRIQRPVRRSLDFEIEPAKSLLLPEGEDVYDPGRGRRTAVPRSRRSKAAGTQSSFINSSACVLLNIRTAGKRQQPINKLAPCTVGSDKITEVERPAGLMRRAVIVVPNIGPMWNPKQAVASQFGAESREEQSDCDWSVALHKP